MTEQPDETSPGADDRASDAGARPATPTDPVAKGASEAATDAPQAESGEVSAEPDAVVTVNAAELAALVAERDDLSGQVLRGRADYDNLNKRRHREVAEARDRGAAAVVERLLEVLDNFGFALQAASASEDAQLAKGVELVHSQLVQALSDTGLQEVPGAGTPFDPAHHEALMSEDDGQEREQPEVAEVLRTGYTFKGQLLRAASVKVVN